MPLATGIAVVAAGALTLLDGAGAVELDLRWGLALMCVVAGCGVLAVARPAKEAYAGTLVHLAESRRLPLWAVRAAPIVTAPVAGAGVAAYALASLAQILWAPQPPPAQLDWRRPVGTGLIGLGAVVGATRAGFQVGSDELLWSVLLAGSGLSLFWRLPGRQRKGAEGDTFSREAVFWLGLGLAGAAIFFTLGNTGLFDEAGGNIAGTAAAIAVLALIVGPRWLRTSRALAAERLERARATERAEVGGMLHDSVLQTLALIQAAPTTRPRSWRSRAARSASCAPGCSTSASPPSRRDRSPPPCALVAAEVEDAHRSRSTWSPSATGRWTSTSRL